jgi:hypothetical protein
MSNCAIVRNQAAGLAICHHYTADVANSGKTNCLLSTIDFGNRETDASSTRIFSHAGVWISLKLPCPTAMSSNYRNS